VEGINIYKRWFTYKRKDLGVCCICIPLRRKRERKRRDREGGSEGREGGKLSETREKSQSQLLY